MKRKIQMTLFFIFLTFTVMADPPDPDGPGSGDGGALPGGGAPIGSGTFIIISMAAAYTGRKLYLIKSENTYP